MSDDLHVAVVTRRTFIVTAAASVAVVSALSALMSAVTAEAGDSTAGQLERSPLFQDEFKKIVGTATPVEGKITLELPEIAENGNFVPLTISVDSPMTETEHVKTIHVLSTSNPVARVASFHLSPLNAVARVQSRMRLSKTQDVIAVAELSDGSLAIATALVKVTIGGCGS